MLYDDNGISIDGETRGWFTDDTPRRFEAYGWHVQPGIDGRLGVLGEKARRRLQRHCFDAALDELPIPRQAGIPP